MERTSEQTPDTLHKARTEIRQKSDLLFKIATDALYILDPSGTLIETSDSFPRMLGYTREEMLGMSVSVWNGQWAGEDLRRELDRNFRLEYGKTRVFETLHRHKDGSLIPVEINTTLLKLESGLYLYNSARSIARRKANERKIRRLSDFNAMLARVNEAVATATDEPELLREICHLAVQYAHLSLAWIGRPGKDGLFRFLASSGATEYLEGTRVSANPDLPEGQGAAGPTWREGLPIFLASFSGHFSFWRERARSFGLLSIGTVPIRRRDRLWAVLAVYHGDEDAFDPDLQSLLTELALNISRGLDRISLMKEERRIHALNDAILDSSVMGVLLTGEGVIRFANPRMVALFGATSDTALLGRRIADFSLDPLDPSQREALSHSPSGSPVRVNLEIRIRRTDGTFCCLEMTGLPFGQEGFDTLWTVADVTERHKAVEQQALLAKALVSVQEGVVITDAHQRVLYVNSAFTSMTGYTMEEMAGETCRRLQGPGTSQEIRDEIRNALRAGNSFRGQILNVKKDGSEFWNLLTIAPVKNFSGEITHFVGVQSDITDIRELRHLNTQLEFRALHDPLTGLPNRHALGQHIDKALSRARRSGTVCAIGMIDLDDFKPVNDTWGHEAGDRLLQELAHRFSQKLRTQDLLARIGGDEFVIVIEDLDPSQVREQLDPLLERLHGAVDSPFGVVPDQSLHIGMSMGLSLFPTDGDDGEKLLKVADRALSLIKEEKNERVLWWQIGKSSQARNETRSLDPYGKQATSLLKKIRPQIEAAIDGFVEMFYGQLEKNPQARSILRTLGEEGMRSLVERQKAHLRFILDPGTSRTMIEERARRLGEIHALVGLTNSLLVQSMTLYRRLLSEKLHPGVIPSRERSRALLIADSRIEDDVETELRVEGEVSGTYVDSLLDPIIPTSGREIDPRRAEIDRLGSLPGIRGALLFRPDQKGCFIVESASGPGAVPILSVFQAPGSEPLLDPASPRGQGIVSKPWRSNRIGSLPSFEHDAGQAFWKAALSGTTGVLSSLDIPVRDRSGRPLYILWLGGAFPNQFESLWMKQFAQGVQQRWEGSPDLCPLPEVSHPPDHALKWRTELFAGGLSMHMQPVVDLPSGRPVSVEALARLRRKESEGDPLPAMAFLPLMSTLELEQIFRMGLDESLKCLSRYHASGLPLDLTLNLPLDVLCGSDCPTRVAQALEEHGVAPSRLTLKFPRGQMIHRSVLEKSIDCLRNMGVKLAIDNLGSSHSDLEMLSTYSFDSLRINPDIPGQLRSTPLETLSLIQTIVRLGEDYGCEVVMKGLEEAGMVEVAAILGVRQGQGFALARPMPADRIPDWTRKFENPVPPGRIRSFLGALAFQWNLLSIDPHLPAPPLSRCPLTDFLSGESLENSEGPRWHRQTHEMGPSAPDVSRKFLAWLIERAQEEAGNISA